MSELNRRIAELSGFYIIQTDNVWWELANRDERLPSIIRAANEEDAWLIAFGAYLPDFSGDPSAALALLAGDRLEWCANTVASGARLWIEFVCSSAYVNPRNEGRSHVEVLGGNYARAFAEAAVQAWVAWKEAGA